MSFNLLEKFSTLMNELSYTLYNSRLKLKHNMYVYTNRSSMTTKVKC